MGIKLFYMVIVNVIAHEKELMIVCVLEVYFL